MKENSIEKLEDSMNDYLDNASVTTVSSDDDLKWADKAIQVGKVLNEQRRIEVEREIELKKIEQSGQITKKDYFVTLVPIGAGIFYWLGNSFLFSATKTQVFEFEKESNFTSSFGQLFKQWIRDIAPFKRRGF